MRTVQPLKAENYDTIKEAVEAIRKDKSKGIGITFFENCLAMCFDEMERLKAVLCDVDLNRQQVKAQIVINQRNEETVRRLQEKLEAAKTVTRSRDLATKLETCLEMIREQLGEVLDDEEDW